MKRFTISFAILSVMAISAAPSYGWISPFSKSDVDSVGDGCVAGFYGNMGHVGTFHVGDVDLLNKRFQEDFRKTIFMGNQYSDHKVIIHSGRGVAPKYSTSVKDQRVDWTVNVWPSRSNDKSKEFRFSIQVDVYLGGNIDLNKLEIPEKYDVVSGGEIEKFVASHAKQKSKPSDESKSQNEE